MELQAHEDVIVIGSCLWCTEPGFSTEHIREFITIKDSHDSALPVWFQEAYADLCSCFDCVEEFHRSLEALLSQKHSSPYNKFAYDSNVARLSDCLTEALSTYHRSKSTIKTEDGDGVANGYSASVYQFKRQVECPLLELLRHPHLLLNLCLCSYFVEALKELRAADQQIEIDKKLPGVYLLLVHPDKLVRRWSMDVVHSLGPVDWEDYDELEEIVHWIMRVVIFDMFSDPQTDTGAAAWDENVLVHLPSHLYDHQSQKDFWVGLCMLLTSLDASCVRSKLMSSCSGHPDIADIIITTIERSDREMSDSVFIPALKCLTVLLDRLGSRFWQFTSTADPASVLDVFLSHHVFQTRIEEMSSIPNRAESNSMAGRTRGDNDEMTNSQMVYQLQNVGEPGQQGSLVVNESVPSTEPVLFSWVVPFLQSLIDFGSCMDSIVNKMFNNISALLSRHSHAISKHGSTVLYEEALSVLSGMVNLLYSKEAYATLLKCRTSWLSPLASASTNLPSVSGAPSQVINVLRKLLSSKGATKFPPTKEILLYLDSTSSHCSRKSRSKQKRHTKKPPSLKLLSDLITLVLNLLENTTVLSDKEIVDLENEVFSVHPDTHVTSVKQEATPELCMPDRHDKQSHPKGTSSYGQSSKTVTLVSPTLSKSSHHPFTSKPETVKQEPRNEVSTDESTLPTAKKRPSVSGGSTTDELEEWECGPQSVDFVKFETSNKSSSKKGSTSKRLSLNKSKSKRYCFESTDETPRRKLIKVPLKQTVKNEHQEQPKAGLTPSVSSCGTAVDSVTINEPVYHSGVDHSKTSLDMRTPPLSPSSSSDSEFPSLATLLITPTKKLFTPPLVKDENRISASKAVDFTTDLKKSKQETFVTSGVSSQEQIVAIKQTDSCDSQSATVEKPVQRLDAPIFDSDKNPRENMPEIDAVMEFTKCDIEDIDNFSDSSQENHTLHDKSPVTHLSMSTEDTKYTIEQKQTIVNSSVEEKPSSLRDHKSDELEYHLDTTDYQNALAFPDSQTDSNFVFCDLNTVASSAENDEEYETPVQAFIRDLESSKQLAMLADKSDSTSDREGKGSADDLSEKTYYQFIQETSTLSSTGDLHLNHVVSDTPRLLRISELTKDEPLSSLTGGTDSSKVVLTKQLSHSEQEDVNQTLTKSALGTVQQMKPSEDSYLNLSPVSSFDSPVSSPRSVTVVSAVSVDLFRLDSESIDRITKECVRKSLDVNDSSSVTTQPRKRPHGPSTPSSTAKVQKQIDEHSQKPVERKRKRDSPLMGKNVFAGVKHRELNYTSESHPKKFKHDRRESKDRSIFNHTKQAQRKEITRVHPIKCVPPAIIEPPGMMYSKRKSILKKTSSTTMTNTHPSAKVPPTRIPSPLATSSTLGKSLVQLPACSGVARKVVPVVACTATCSMNRDRFPTQSSMLKRQPTVASSGSVTKPDISSVSHKHFVSKLPKSSLSKPTPFKNTLSMETLDVMDTATSPVIFPVNQALPIQQQPSHHPRKPPPTIHTKPNKLRKMDDLYACVLLWNPNEFLFPEQDEKGARICPPCRLNLIRGVRDVPLTFLSYDEYFDVFAPLFFMELWQSVFDNIEPSKMKPAPWTCRVDSVTNSSFYQIINVKAIMLSEKARIYAHPTDRDLVVFQTQGEKRFALVEHYEHNYVQHSGGSKKSECEVSIRLKLYGHTMSGSSLDGSNVTLSVVMSLTSEIRQWTGLINFHTSILIRDLLFPRGGAYFCQAAARHVDQTESKGSSRFNPSQSEAITTAARAMCDQYVQPRVFLLQGPPGTGKTHTISGLVQTLFEKLLKMKSLKPATSSLPGRGSRLMEKRRPHILICAPSNAAVDEVIRKMIRDGIVAGFNRDQAQSSKEEMTSLNVVRVGSKDKIHQKIIPLSLDELAKKTISNQGVTVSREMDKLRQRISYVEKKIDDVEKRVFIMKQNLPNANADLESLYSDLKKYKLEKDELTQHHKQLKIKRDNNKRQESQSRKRILMSADIVCATLCGSASSVISDCVRTNSQHFDCVIVDEAAQCTELDILVPLQFHSTKLIIVGDPLQLPATIKSREAESLGYGQSLFERLYKYFTSRESNESPVRMLNVQYRMLPEICYFPSQQFYSHRLQTDRSVLSSAKNLKFNPFLVFDLKNCREERIDNSFRNTKECTCLIAILKVMQQNQVSPRSVGVITPYRAQMKDIKHRLEKELPTMSEIEVGTVDGFQGREKDIIILSCVRASSSSGSVGFLRNRQRLNVSLTRAKIALYVLGHVDTLQVNKEWSALIDHARHCNALVSVTTPSHDARTILKTGPKVLKYKLSDLSESFSSSSQFDHKSFRNTKRPSSTTEHLSDPRLSVSAHERLSSTSEHPTDPRLSVSAHDPKRLSSTSEHPSDPRLSVSAHDPKRLSSTSEHPSDPRLSVSAQVLLNEYQARPHTNDDETAPCVFERPKDPRCNSSLAHSTKQVLKNCPVDQATHGTKVDIPVAKTIDSKTYRKRESSDSTETDASGPSAKRIRTCDLISRDNRRFQPKTDNRRSSSVSSSDSVFDDTVKGSVEHPPNSHDEPPIQTSRCSPSSSARPNRVSFHKESSRLQKTDEILRRTRDMEPHSKKRRLPSVPGKGQLRRVLKNSTKFT